MNRTLLILTVLLFTGFASAQAPHFYISGAAQWSEPTGDFGKEHYGEADSGGGGEVDIGLVSDYGSTYIGYRLTKFSQPSSDVLEWEPMNRFVAGLRWHVFGSQSSPIVPILGAGITLGKTRLKNPYLASPAIPENYKELDSKTSVGWFVEGGVRVRIVDKLSLVGCLQYHQFDANFEDAVFDEDDPLEFDIEYITTSAGLQIYF